MAFKFKGQDVPSYVIIQNVELSLLSPISVETMRVSGRAGSYDLGNEYDQKEIAVEYTIEGTSVADLRAKARDFATFLLSEKAEELILLEEPDKKYYAKVEGATTYKEEGFVAQGSFTFLLTDPHLYGATQTVPMVNGSNTVTMGGNTVAYPTIDLTFSGASTDLVLKNGEEILYLGQPAPVEGQIPAPKRNTIIAESCDTIGTSWTVGTDTIGVDGGNVVGNFQATGGQWKVQTFGSGTTYTKWHGPMLVRDLGKNVKNFTTEMYFTLKASHVNQITRVELILLNSVNERIGKVALTDLHASTNSPMFEGRIDRPTPTPKQSKSIAYTDVAKGAYANFYGRILIQRIDDVWTVSVGKRDVVKNTLFGRFSKIFYDTAKTFSQDVRAIAVHVGQYGNRPFVSNTGIESVYFYEENAVDPAYNIPNIVEAGDTIRIDAGNGIVYKNGETAFDLIDPTSRFFGLRPGTNTIEISPDIVSSGTLSVTERWL